MSKKGKKADKGGAGPKNTVASSDRAVLEIFSPDGLPGGLVALNEAAAWSISAIAACVNLIAGAISSMPANVLGRNRDDWTLTRINDDPVWWILNEEMTPRWSAAAGWEYLIGSLLLLGDAFARIWRDPNGRVLGIEPLHPSRVRVIVSRNGQRLIYEVQPDPTITTPEPGQRAVILDQDDVIHITGAGFDGVRSPSPLRHALRMSGAVAYATQDFSARFFANQARPDYAIVAPAGARWSEADKTRLGAEIDARHRGVNAHRPMLMSGGADIKFLSLPLEDLQLIATRQFQIEEIARAYGVPPFMIGHNEKTTSWGSGVEQMGTAFVRYTLSRHLTKIHNELNRKLFRTYAKVVEFDTFELERADMKSMFTAFRMAIGRAGEPGFLSVDEVRAYLNRGKAPADINKGTGNAKPAQPAQP